MKTRLLIILLTLNAFSLLMLSACSSSTAANLEGDVYSQSDGITAQDFTGIDVVTGESVSLADFEDNAVLLNFVNYGCSESINQVVSSQLLAIRDLTDERDDFTPVSIFCGCCPTETLRNFATQNSFDWPWILDTDNSIINKYSDYLQTYGYPTLVLIDNAQNIREVVGNTDANALSDKIDNLTIVEN
ncbi:MAG: redoxin domain-containing protein [Chloroflexi bacterium]|nr:redoxin domain-containing protein [Chloroflexota bacterium]MBT7081995.1 redoxin domain-containing protein [Chloroflexota bacterium]MBT7289658.1 redoxin domain-containing protein [Chloroflexota bacterium]